MLTILGGIPGVGKSRFVQTYAEALGLQYGEELVWIPISPSYQEHMIYLVTFIQMVLLLKVKRS